MSFRIYFGIFSLIRINQMYLLIKLFSCTPCRGAFGGKSTAKPPTRQRSHQTKNSYHSRITRHFVPQTNSAFVVYSFCLIVHFWLLSDLLTCVLNRLCGHFVFPTLLLIFVSIAMPTYIN